MNPEIYDKCLKYVENNNNQRIALKLGMLIDAFYNMRLEDEKFTRSQWHYYETLIGSYKEILHPTTSKPDQS